MATDRLDAALETLRSSLSGWLGWRRKQKQALLEAIDVIGNELQALKSRSEARHSAGLDMDRFYLHFENRYRGSEESIRAKLSPYLEDLEAKQLDRASAAILDIGCGRGEWLTLLREAGYVCASGVDTNERMVETCLQKGLDLLHSDVFDFLSKTPSSTYDAITGFHIIEHFPFDRILKLLQLCFRVLKPGGIALFETPNPRNLIVGGNTFHFDPTHVRPVPSELLACAAEHAGFVVKRIYQRNPYPDLVSAANALPAEAVLLRNALTCGLDYGIALEKPTGEA